MLPKEQRKKTLLENRALLETIWPTGQKTQSIQELIHRYPKYDKKLNGQRFLFCLYL
jgi:hypothetical protein